MEKINCMALLLAGGEGKRLSPFTADLPKPAVSFGCGGRIIDYPLSNCVHSGIEAVGVLTQYKADSLESYIGGGEVWLRWDGSGSGIDLLPSSALGTGGYAGTADAIYRNRAYIEAKKPDHVLVLSADHIYRMDYRPLIEEHARRGAVATVVGQRVGWEEASRFGIMNTDAEGRITRFEEKPANPRSNLASLGIYVFRWADLRRHLEADAADPASSRDFGKDVLPCILRSGDGLYAHVFDGYWKDVGTIESLWESHMDLLNGKMALHDPAWPVYSGFGTGAGVAHSYGIGRTEGALASVGGRMEGGPVSAGSRVEGGRVPAGCGVEGGFVPAGSRMEDRLVSAGCRIEGVAIRSVLSSGVRMEAGARVTDSVVMPGARIGAYARVYRAIIGEGAVIDDGAVVGSPDGAGIAVVGPGERVAAAPQIVSSLRALKGAHRMQNAWAVSN